MQERRLVLANLIGPAGYVSADDGEVIEWSQQGFEQKPSHCTVFFVYRLVSVIIFLSARVCSCAGESARS